MGILRQNKDGMVTVEATIWIPFICIIFLLLLKILFHWTELGIVQGELLVNACTEVSKERNVVNHTVNNEKVQYPKLHFLEKSNWKTEVGTKVLEVSFTGYLPKVFHRKVTRKTKIRKEHPITILRRRKRIGEAIQEIGLP